MSEVDCARPIDDDGLVRIREDKNPQLRRSEITAGARIVAPACVAVIPLGLALGVLVVQSGLHWWWGPVLAAFVFAGSLEFLLVGLLAATAPLAQIALTSMMVNFRHVFYALSFPLHRITGRGWKLYSTYALTDEAYALTSDPAAGSWSRARIISVQLLFHLAWVASVALGSVVGTFIPPEVVGLEFAVTALFAVLAVEAYRARRSAPLPLLAVACAIIGELISPSNMLLIAMALFVGAIVVEYYLRGRCRARRGQEALDAE